MQAPKGKLQVPGGAGAPASSPQASPRLGSKRSTRGGSKQSTASKQSLSRVASKIRKGSKNSSAAAEPALPGGWAGNAERNNFLQKVRRDLGHRDNERLERLQAVLEVRQLALQRQNCWHLWADEQVRRALLDAIQGPDPEQGKSLYVDEGPPPNHPTVRTAACGVLVQLALDDAVRDEMARDTLVRESIVEALEQLPPLPPPEDEESSPKAKDPAEPSPKEPTPFDIQSRAQQLLALLLPAGICAKALRRPGFVQADAEFMWIEEEEEEEMSEDDPVVEPMPMQIEVPAVAPEVAAPAGPEAVSPGAEPRKPGDASSAASSEVDPSALLADVEAVLNAKKPSTDEDVLYAGAACADPLNCEELEQLPPWRPGAAQSRRLDTLWTFAATRDNAESSRLWRFQKVRDVLLTSAEAHQPDCVRISAFGTLAALAAREENRLPMWADDRVKKVFVLGASEQVMVPADPSGADDEAPKVAEMRPQRWEIRLQAISGLAAFAQTDDQLRQELWSDARVVASLQNAAEKPGPLRNVALQALRELTQCWEIQEPMVSASAPLVLGSASADESLSKRQRRGCELARDRLLVA